MVGDVPIAGHVVLLMVLVLLNPLKSSSIGNAHGLHKSCQILHVEVPVRASMCLSRTRRMLGENLLTAHWAVATAATIRVTSNITVRVADVVLVLLVELVVVDLVEAPPPEEQTLLQIETNTLEEEGVLEASVVLEVRVATETAVKVGHTRREVL